MAFDLKNARCPKCGHPSVVALAKTMVEVVEGGGPSYRCGRLYGVPDILVMGVDTPAECNSSRCDWAGTVGEVVPSPKS